MLILTEQLVKLPDPLLIETLSFVDVKDYEWIAGFVLDEKTKKKLYQVCIRNGGQIAYEFYVD
ncbi:hypothetical protein [Peribacillus sp. NPDC097295]|uniref:hypothetical protein n=1 Tax=Peribacillus sp. NPDC097295 TaxID=3364402 RepID=UPI003822902E